VTDRKSYRHRFPLSIIQHDTAPMAAERVETAMVELEPTEEAPIDTIANLPLSGSAAAGGRRAGTSHPGRRYWARHLRGEVGVDEAKGLLLRTWRDE